MVSSPTSEHFYFAILGIIAPPVTPRLYYDETRREKVTDEPRRMAGLRQELQGVVDRGEGKGRVPGQDILVDILSSGLPRLPAQVVEDRQPPGRQPDTSPAAGSHHVGERSHRLPEADSPYPLLGRQLSGVSSPRRCRAEYICPV
jgi:hypothetical protein